MNEPPVNEPTVVTGLVSDPIDVPSLVEQTARPDCGAVVVFEGRARSPSAGRTVVGLEYEAYEQRAEAQLGAFAREAADRFGLGAAVAVHRVGTVPVGDPAVVVVAAAAHRREAFQAACGLIDRIKAEAAIWKKELFSDDAAWVA